MRNRQSSSITVTAGGTARNRSCGFTAVEVLISLLILFVLTAFSFSYYQYSKNIQLKTAQTDLAAQLARDVLSRLKTGTDWREVATTLENPAKLGTQFNLQLVPQPTQEKGLSNIELTISWLSPYGIEQQVFNTTVLDASGEAAP